jgi:hypothetical protein
LSHAALGLLTQGLVWSCDVQGIHVSLQLLSALDRKHNGMMQVRQKRMQRRAKAKAAKANPLSGDGAHGEGLALDDDDEAMGAGAAELDAEREAREAEEIAAAADEMDEIQEKVCQAPGFRRHRLHDEMRWDG